MGSRKIKIGAHRGILGVQAEMTIPISSSMCEHFFSAMGRLEKLVTGTSMSQGRFTKLFILSIEIDLTTKIVREILLQKFALSNRKSNLKNFKYLQWKNYKSKGVGKTKNIVKKQAAKLLIDNIIHEIVDKSNFNTTTPKNIEVYDVLKLWICSNQLLHLKKKVYVKTKKCDSLNELNMSVFEFLTRLANEEVLSITYIPYQKDCCEVEMTENCNS
ncbi:interferon-inducible double-stranded RNA-dependent protein kinase activator A [Aphis craccivora]|uniref:Interferon-inducible double-stranded RNA-dependent protein kinase activator A n=1 Tax=Aphis craccivora TaxID=307492 RepID=A0A6G0YAS8_APHCR|nr:interferon-inducible double-stranded RNA-dependent protein kinase activator A [Aphis craccivora]